MNTNESIVFSIAAYIDEYGNLYTIEDYKTLIDSQKYLLKPLYIKG